MQTMCIYFIHNNVSYMGDFTSKLNKLNILNYYTMNEITIDGNVYST